MTRTEIRKAGKNLVVWYGPDIVMEFGSEKIGEVFADLAPEDAEAVRAEARHQAQRVYDFLGVE